MTEKSASSIATQKLEDQLTCPICLDQFTDPRTLPCLHSFCTQCLKGLPLDPKGDGQYSLSCPTCRSEADLPQQGAGTFHKAFHLNNLIEVHELMKKVSGEKKTVCDNCSKEEATGYCPECDKFYCQSCNDVHKKWGPTSTHKLMSLSEVSIKATQMVSVKPEPVMNCPSHSKTLDLYCVTCEQPICYHCTIKSHKGHIHDLVNDAFKQSKTEMQSSLQRVEGKITKMNGKKEELLESQKQHQEQGEARKRAINQLCDEFVQGIEKARTLGLHCVEMGVQNMMSFKDQQIKAVQTQVDELLSCKDHTEHNLKLAMPTQVLTAKKQLMARIELLLESGQYEPTIQKAFCMDENQDSSHEMDVAVNILKEKLTIPFCYPKEVYRQCELVPDFPEVVGNHTTSTATFTILFQSRAILVDKSDVSCSFIRLPFIHGHHSLHQSREVDQSPFQPPSNETTLHSSNEFIHGRHSLHQSREVDQSRVEIPCEVYYLTEDDKVKYQVKFTPKESGNYSLELKLGGEKISTKHVNVEVVDVVDVVCEAVTHENVTHENVIREDVPSENVIHEDVELANFLSPFFQFGFETHQPIEQEREKKLPKTDKKRVMGDSRRARRRIK